MNKHKARAKVHPDAEALFQKMKEEIISCRGTREQLHHSLIGYLHLHDTLPEYLIWDCESPIEQMLAVALAFAKPDYMAIQSQIEVI